MKPEDKAKAQKALDALEMFSPKFTPLVYTETDRKRDEAITALRHLLEQPEPVQEPTPACWQGDDCCPNRNACCDAQHCLYTTPPAQPEPEQEPDVIMHPHNGTWSVINPPPKGVDDVALYYAQPAVYKPVGEVQEYKQRQFDDGGCVIGSFNKKFITSDVYKLPHGTKLYAAAPEKG